MQLRQQSSYWFGILVPALILSIGSGASAIHCFGVCCWSLIFIAGLNTDNYYNMAICMWLGGVLLIQNILNVS